MVSPRKPPSAARLETECLGYEVYLDLERIVYDKETSRATFISVWFPSEKIKASLKKDPNFKLIAGKELGVFVLVYMADLRWGAVPPLVLGSRLMRAMRWPARTHSPSATSAMMLP